MRYLGLVNTADGDVDSRGSKSSLPLSHKSAREETTSLPLSQQDAKTADSPTAFERDSMGVGRGIVYNGPTKPDTIYHSQEQHFDRIGATNRPTPNELESSRPSSPLLQDVSGVVQSIWDPYMNRWRVAAACFSAMGQGLNDSGPGALLPSIEKYYNINYATVSIIFISNALGFILAAFFIHAIDSKLGRARTIMLSEAVMIAGYTMMGSTPPFGVFVVGYFISGLGLATVLALNNVFCANLANSTVILGMFHGSYGIGGIMGPIIATSFVSKGIVFSRYYLVILGLRAISLVFSGITFWQFERDNRHEQAIVLSSNVTAASPSTDDNETEPVAVTRPPCKLQELAKALKSRTAIIGALFIFAYQGSEVSISGWVISFLISYRDGNPRKVGYVTSGFWAGITLGRFVLSPIAHRVGEKIFTFGVIVGAIAFQLLVWFVPSAVGDSVAVAFEGILLGPIYPAATNIFSRLIPRQYQATAIAFISSAGSSGGALAPFMTGILAQAAGTWVLHPICISLFAFMIVCWGSLPRVGKKNE